jgi:hypothetical protein
VTIGYTNTFNIGNAIQGTGYAEIVFAYNSVGTVLPPTIAKAFLSASIAAGGTSVVTLTLSNSNALADLSST